MRDRTSQSRLQRIQENNMTNIGRNMNAVHFLESCSNGKLDEVRSALARGEDVNTKDCFGHTALMQAVLNRHNSIVKLLLDQPGVKANERNNYGGANCGSTALHLAVQYNNPEGARMLLLHVGMNSANSTDFHDDTAVVFAVRLRMKEVLRELVRHESVNLDVPEGFFGER